jgi:predicted nucleic acid-binding protein
LLERHRGPVLVPVLVVTEVAYLLGSRVGVETEVRFLGDLAAGELLPQPVEPGDWLRIAELVARYGDLPLGTVDASVVAAAERVGSSAIATLDRRHFSVVRPSHVDVFDLLP